MLHKTREVLVKQRTMSVNALRGHLAEFGLVIAKGISRVDGLLELAKADVSLPEEAKETVKLLAVHLKGLDRSTPRNTKLQRPARAAEPANCSTAFPKSAR